LKRLTERVSNEVAAYLTRLHPRPLAGPWRTGWSLGFHSSFSGEKWTRSAIGELTYRLKYQQDLSTLPQIVEQVQKLVGDHPELLQVDAIVPVPPSSPRTFGPVRVLANALGKKFNIPVSPVLVKTRQTRPQKEMRTFAQKRNNVAGAFAVRGEVRGKRLLLMDDLFDSGATLEEATRVLKRAGAATICVLTMTRTIHTDG